MVIRVVSVGLTKTVFVREGLAVYLNRLGHYARVEWNEIPDPPSRGSAPDQKRAGPDAAVFRWHPARRVFSGGVSGRCPSAPDTGFVIVSTPCGA